MGGVGSARAAGSVSVVRTPSPVGERRSSSKARVALGILLVGHLLLAVTAGAFDSPLVPVLPAGVSPPRWTVVGARWLGLDHLGRAGLTVASVGVLVVLAGAFLVLVHEAWRERVRLAPVLVVAGLALAAVWAAPLLLSRDVHSYAAYGRIGAVHGENPYAVPPSAFPADPFVRVTSAEWIHTRPVYGPVFVLLAEGIAGLTRDAPDRTILAFKSLAALSVALAAASAVLACRRAWPGRAPLAAVLVGANPVVLVHAVGGGHVDALIACLVGAAGLIAVRAWRPAGEGNRPAPELAVTLLLLLAVLVKVVLAIAVLLWIAALWRTAWRGRRARRLALHLGCALALALALFAPFVRGGWRALSALARASSLQGWASPARLVGRGARAVLDSVGGNGLGSAGEQAVIAAFLAVFALALLRMMGRARPQDAPPTWSVALLFFALCAPYFTPWYATWFLPFLALVPSDDVLWAGAAACALLAMTGVPAEPGSAPGAWHAMVLAVHYGAAALMLPVLATVGRWIWRPQGSP